MSWELVPEELLLQIFSYLPYQEICKAGLVCSKWWKVGKDDILWRKILRKDFQLKESVGVRQNCWRQYQRMIDECPKVCHQVLDAHSDEVLFVSFSSSGELNACCDKMFYRFSHNLLQPLDRVNNASVEAQAVQKNKGSKVLQIVFSNMIPSSHQCKGANHLLQHNRGPC